MRPSSSPSEQPAALGLFDGVLARGHVRGNVSDAGWLQAMLDAEAALARAGARADLLSPADAEDIARACDADRFDVGELAQAATASGNPVVPLVRALSEAVPDQAAGSVHLGATSQDILDSAAMLVSRRSLEFILDDLRHAAEAAARLTEAHRATIIAGRTLLQQALPTTFGLKAAGWLVALDDTAERLDDVRTHRLAAQLGGAAGTLASLGPAGPEVLRHFAAALELAEPALPWHTDRTRIAELAGALAAAAAAIAKITHDVVLLAQTEVAEVREGGPQRRGGSSTLPHKRNPVAAVSAAACAAQAPGLAGSLFAAAGRHEHERAAGAWHAEWAPLSRLLTTVGSAASWLRDCLEHLEVDPERMRANLDHSGDALLAERVVAALVTNLGRLAAHDLVEQAARKAVTAGRSLGEVLDETPEIRAHLDADAIAALLDPAGYLGSAPAFIQRALDAHQRVRDRGGRP